MVFEELSVEVGADTASFNAGMSRVEDSLDDVSTDAIQTAGALAVLENRMSSAGREAATTSGMFSALSISTTSLTSTVHGLTTALTVGLIPAVTVLVGALTPIVAAMGGFVAIAGSIAGLGLAGTIGAIATNTEQLKTQFGVLTDIMADDFAPVFDAAAEVLLALMNELIAVLPQLVPAQDVIDTLATAFEELGVVLINALPAFVDLATTLATEFLPPFVDFVESILPQLPGMIMGMVNAFERLLPSFMEAGRLLGQFLPELLEFGFAALRVVGPALERLAITVTDALQAFNNLDQGTQDLLTTLGLIAPLAFGLISLFGGPLALAIGGLAAAWATNFGDMKTTTDNTFSDIESTLTNGIQRIKNELGQEFTSEVQTAFGIFEQAAGAAMDALGGLLDFILDAFITQIVVGLNILQGDWQGAITAMRDFFTRTFNGLLSFWERWGEAAAQNVFKGMLSEFPEPLRGVLREELGVEQGQLSGPVVDQIQTPQQRQQQQIENAVPNNINLTVTGDTGVIEDVAVEYADRELREASRQANRQSGRNPNI